MRELFDKFFDRSKFKRKFVCVDVAITIHTPDVDLLDHLTGLLLYFLPKPEKQIIKEITCVVAQTTAIEKWPDSLCEMANTLSLIEDLTLGQATRLSSDCGMTLIIDSAGSVYHSGDGRFLCLVAPPDQKLKDGRYQLLGLINVLLSETLLLTNKLLIHGGAVGNGESCQIWTGDSGAGKTTQIMKLVSKGWDFYGEDQIIIGKNKDDQWMVWPFWRQIKASAETAKFFPTRQDISLQSPNDRGKFAFEDIERVLQVAKPPALPLSVIHKIIPDKSSILKQQDYIQAFQHISSDFMHSLMPNSTAKVMDIVLDIAADIPIFLVSRDMLEQPSRDRPTN